MSINSYVQAAQLLYQNNYNNEALCLVCCAIDACAAIKYPELTVANRYKQFLSKHFRTISRFGFPGIVASSMRIKVECNIDSLMLDNQGYVDMTQIIYIL